MLKQVSNAYYVLAYILIWYFQALLLPPPAPDPPFPLLNPNTPKNVMK